MDRKSLGHLLFAIITIFAALFAIFVYGDGYLRQITVKNTFQANIRNQMRFLPLDYFNEPEIVKCQELYQALKTEPLTFITPKIWNNRVSYKIGGEDLVSETGKDYNFGQRKFLTSERTVVVKAADRHYLITEWFAKDKYAFYYIDNSEEYREINCRFDVETQTD